MPDIDQKTGGDTFEVEITDLHLPRQAESNLFGHLASLLIRWQRAEYLRRRRWLSGALLASLTLVLLVALLNPAAGVTALLAEHWPFQGAHVSANGISSSRYAPLFFTEIACPSQAAWSPDSSYVALLGYTQPCNQNQYVPAQVDIYDASTARQVAHWQPDAAILTALNRPPPASSRTRGQLARRVSKPTQSRISLVPPIQYLQILWSPDNKRLAVSFGAATVAVNYEGLFLANLDGSHPEVLLQPEFSDIDPGQFASFTLRWDLQRSSAVSLKALAPALTYMWNADGTLAPVTARSSSSAYAPLPPGNPDGGQTFSIWQPGRTMLRLIHTYHVYLWSTSFAAWSPDKRYLITNFTFTGLMEPAGQAFPDGEALTALGVKDVPRVPEHDPALTLATPQAQTVAWNPTGTWLAVYDLAGVIDLYNCRTGQFLVSFTPRFTQTLSGTATLLSWSPDGHFLLLSSAQWGLITLWKASNLLGN